MIPLGEGRGWSGSGKGLGGRVIVIHCGESTVVGDLLNIEQTLINS
jgi:hypothetical protein